MKVSRLGLKTMKSRGTDESLAQEILFQSAQLKRHAAGIYGLGNMLVRTRNNIMNIIRSKLEKYECVEVSLPVLQPKQLWEESGRWEGYASSKQMFYFDGRNGTYCLAPTAEEIIMDLMKYNLISYKDLPVNIYQIGLKFRDEIRVRGGLLRSKEFTMKDGYSFHESHEDMVEEYERMKACYKEIFSALNLDAIPVKAVSAEMGGKVSEEFMHISDIGEDKILYDLQKGVAFNTEILDNPELLEALKAENPDLDIDALEKRSSIELGHIFQLGQFYSKSMGGYFTSREGKKEAYYMGCYGIGINRTLGAICEKYCDNDGLIWPEFIAPYKCLIINGNQSNEAAEGIYKLLMENQIDVLWDDRDMSFGAKIKDGKLLGIPYMIIIGKSYAESGNIEIELRKNGEKCFVKAEELVSYFKSK
ncbi:prolyl-tRNA synthetase [Ruminiclostridium sufflavum DSM 19573]|uniref:Proline--tRNA ligase n=1 Tax=Ruminiclostridium sufflavum DSM 19573 TaxID=1121337 RepID=A0A318XRD3_9FIRM|nr:aminoacyl--tRNA ligase-related protein [Ruminiclostridium sufflavum]PYG90209.1 prolyl-tRNA synthetase [Ruminiclostridium sufflavum DSM 19573]